MTTTVISAFVPWPLALQLSGQGGISGIKGCIIETADKMSALRAG